MTTLTEFERRTLAEITSAIFEGQPTLTTWKLLRRIKEVRHVDDRGAAYTFEALRTFGAIARPAGGCWVNMTTNDEGH